MWAKLARSVVVLGKTRHILDHKASYTLYCSPVYQIWITVWWYDVTCIKAPYTHYAYYKKRVIRIVNNVRYREHTDVLFLKSHALKFMDLVKYKTAEIMYEARNNLLPHNIQKKQCVRTTLKSMCISICGVNLWDGLDIERKKSPNINQFKK